MKTLVRSLLAAAVFVAVPAFAFSDRPGSCAYPGGQMTGGGRTGTGAFTVTTSSPTYVPGQAMTVTVANTNNLLFKGFLLQAVRGNPGAADTNQIGTFSGLGAGMAFVGGCSGGANVAVGHNSPTGKQTASVTWTPPANATGPITFHLVAVVATQEWYGQTTLITATINPAAVDAGTGGGGGATGGGGGGMATGGGTAT
ncbi:MAG: Reeler domain-containing protein, partial [Archangium sp.]|nr:Reeler domain-containing protein [Archangium sp.]